MRLVALFSLIPFLAYSQPIKTKLECKSQDDPSNTFTFIIDEDSGSVGVQQEYQTAWTTKLYTKATAAGGIETSERDENRKTLKLESITGWYGHPDFKIDSGSLTLRLNITKIAPPPIEVTPAPNLEPQAEVIIGDGMSDIPPEFLELFQQQEDQEKIKMEKKLKELKSELADLLEDLDGYGDEEESTEPRPQIIEVPEDDRITATGKLNFVYESAGAQRNIHVDVSCSFEEITDENASPDDKTEEK